MLDIDIDDGDIAPALRHRKWSQTVRWIPSKLARVIGLIATGFVKRQPEAGGSSRLRLTEKGQDVLAERGAGLNEA